jgi:hypothetical protein
MTRGVKEFPIREWPRGGSSTSTRAWRLRIQRRLLATRARRPASSCDDTPSGYQPNKELPMQNQQNPTRDPHADPNDVERAPGRAPDQPPTPSRDPRNAPDRIRDPLKQPGDLPDVKPDVIANRPGDKGGQGQTQSRTQQEQNPSRPDSGHSGQ